MGRLIGLELSNFKSYKGTASVGFGTANFTSVIGPNGSGKSNMMDAISFVLGVRSSHLRSTQLKDLVYRGRIDERSIEDPDTAYVMAIYEKDGGEVLKLKREIVSSGSSEYRINGQQVTAAQYAEILRKENILIKAKNFLVFQGDVEKIAGQSSDALTELIETVSGSIEFKAEYDQLAEAKEKAHDNTALQNTKRRALKEELRQYQSQCQEIEQYDQKTDDLAKLILSKHMSRLYFNENQYKDTRKDFKATEAKSKQLDQSIEKKEEELRDFIRAGSDSHSNSRDLEDEIELDRSKLSEKRMDLIPVDSEASQVSKRLKEYTKRVSVLEQERDEQQEAVQQTSSQLKKIKKSYAVYQKGQEAERKRHAPSKSLPREVVEEYGRLREQFLMKGGHIETKLADLIDDKESAETKLEAYTSKRSLIKSREQQLLVTRSDTKAKYDEVKSQIDSTNSAIASKKRELNSIKASRDGIEQDELEIKTTLKEVLLRLNELGSLKRESVREKKLRENCASLKRLFPGVRGLVSDVCKPKKKKYDQALSTVIGRNIDSIVVTNLSVAAECISYLKDQRAGSASFIPLDTVTSKSVSQYRGLASTVVPAIDVAEYEPEYEKAIQYVCGDSLICDNMEVARAVRWERHIDTKVVTLEGSMIHKSGLMTGGQTATSNDKWDKAELNSLLSKKDSLKFQLDELDKKKPSELRDRSINSDIERFENELPSLRNTRDDLKKAIADTDAEIRNQKRLAKELDQEAHDFQVNTVKPIEEKIKQSEVELQLVQGTVYSGFCKSNDFSSIEEYEQKYGLEDGQASRESVKYQKEIQRLESRLEFEKERLADYNDRLAKLSEDEQKFKKSSKETESKLKELSKEIDRLESELEVLQEELDDVRSNMKETSDESVELKSSVHDLKLESNSNEKKLVALQENVVKLTIEKLGILRNCKMENIELPLKSGSLDDVPLEENESVDEESQLGGILEDIVVDYSSLPKKYKQGDSDETIKGIEQEIGELESELANMSPNMKARDRLDEATRRLAEEDDEFNACKENERQVVADFEECKLKRYEAFAKAFKHISSEIDQVYKDLTKSKIAPLGGSAYLTLEDEDEPYLAGVKYHAMPPMKRFRDMEQLSGGEKTVAALALLFAVHSYQPSPFFVLDEVDAALDNVNLGRVARYINEHAGPNFQFIVISLKNQLFENSDALVGIYRERELNTSKTLTVDLRRYAEEEVA